MRELVLVSQKLLGFALLGFQGILFSLHNLETTELLRSTLVGFVDEFGLFLNRRFKTAGTDDILEVLEQALLVLVLGTRGHLGDGLDLALQNEETLVIQVDALGLEESGCLGEGGLARVDKVLRGVVAVGRARDNEFATGDHLEAVAREVDDLAEPDLDTALREIFFSG